jgi:hypothetical protein
VHEILPFPSNRAKTISHEIEFAMTTNKSQGQTLKSFGLYPAPPVFLHVQLCVAYSQSSSFGSVAIGIIEGHRHRIKSFTVLNVKKGSSSIRNIIVSTCELFAWVRLNIIAVRSYTYTGVRTGLSQNSTKEELRPRR